MTYDMDAVWREYGRPVYYYLLSLAHDEQLAQDLTQETMLRTILNIGSFRGDCKLFSWLCRIASNLYRDEMRRRKQKQVPLEEAWEIAGDEDPARTVMEHDEALRIYSKLLQLEEPYQTVFRLHILSGLPLKEISRRFQKSDSWARVTYYRAKAMIIERMGETQ